MMESVVQKFGGSSISCPDRCAEIFTEDPQRNRIAVVSAVGKDPQDQNGQPKITDKLIELEKAVDDNSDSAISSAQEFVIERNRQAYSMLGEQALGKIIDEAYKYLQPEERINGFQWVGEHLSARLFAELTGATYIPSGLRFSGGMLRLEDSEEAILESCMPAISSGRQAVTEGFFGYDSLTASIVTLPRGGSDTTGVVYAGALSGQGDSWINENYTNKDGILSADPDIVPQPRSRVIPEMTHKEVREKMHGIVERNGVIHGNAIAYASRLGVDMVVKNTFNPDSEGTLITPERDSNPDNPIIAISGKSDIVTISAYDMGMAEASGYLAPILSEVGKIGMSISNVPTGEDSIKLVFNEGVTDERLEHVRDFILSRAISGEKAEVEIARNQGAVYLVGQELTRSDTYTRTVGHAGKLLASEGLSIKEIISHESSPSIALTVDGANVEAIIDKLHEGFIESPA